MLSLLLTHMRCVIWCAGVARSMQNNWQGSLDSFQAAIGHAKQALLAGPAGNPMLETMTSNTSSMDHAHTSSGSSSEDETLDSSFDDNMSKSDDGDERRVILEHAPQEMHVEHESMTTPLKVQPIDKSTLQAIVVQRTLVRSLISAATSCKQLHDLDRAVALLAEAVEHEPRVRLSHLDPLLHHRSSLQKT